MTRSKSLIASTTRKNKTVSGASRNKFVRMFRISPAAMEDAVNKGLGVDVIDDAAAFYQLPKADVLELFRISPASESRWRNQARLLPRAESDRVARVARVTSFAAEMLGDIEEARDWLVRKVPALGGRTPLSYLGTDAGSKIVEDTLVRSIAGVVA